MKKYCLTQCAKRKFSAIWEFIITISIAFLIGIIFILSIILIFSLIGVITQFIALTAFNSWWFHLNIFELGAGITFGIILLGTTGYFTIRFITWLFKNIFYVTKNITMNIIAPEKAECRLFEECKD